MEVRRLAGQRNEIITSHLLRDLGVSRRQERWLRDSKRLTVVHRGVYTTVADPETLTATQQATAACLAAPHAVLSFGTAARLHGIRKSPWDRLEMTIETGDWLWLPRLKVHRTNLLDPDDIHHRLDGLRLTSPERTLFDQAAILDRLELRSALTDALHKDLTNVESLAEIGARMATRGRRGSADFMAVVARMGGEFPLAESDAELVLFDALAARIPELERQIWVELPTRARVRIDMGVRRVKFGPEVDHPFWHANPVKVEADHSRDLQLETRGWKIPRVTTNDVRYRLRSTVASLEAIYHDLCRRAA